MIFTNKFKILVAVLFFLLSLGGVLFNQLTLQKELNSQLKFDSSVMKRDEKIWEALQEKVASTDSQAKPSVTPTPKLITKNNLTK